MKYLPLNALAAGALLVGSLSAKTAGELYEETKSAVSEWAETESLVSKEWNDWLKEKAVLEDLVSLLEGERENLDDKIKQTESSATVSDKRREGIVARKEKLEAAAAVVRESLPGLEDEVRSLLPYLPESYLDSIAPLVRQLPESGAPTQQSLSIRLRNVIGILSQANKFDGTISLETETREFEQGQGKQVNSLYFGFAIAYYSDASGQSAGYGVPTSDGWNWIETPEFGEEILNMISMYQKGRQAEFVELPVVIN